PRSPPPLTLPTSRPLPRSSTSPSPRGKTPGSRSAPPLPLFNSRFTPYPSRSCLTKTLSSMMNSTNPSSTPAASPFQARASSTPIAARELRKGLSRWLSMSTLQTLKPYYPLYTSSAVPARSKKRIPPPLLPSAGTAGTLAMSSRGAESPTPFAHFVRSTTAGLSTDAPIPPAWKGATYAQFSTAASPLPRHAPTARATTLPPSANVLPALPLLPPGPLSPPGMPPQTPLYSHPRTWIWTTCPVSARRQHYKTRLPLAPPSSSRPPEPTRGS